MKRSQFVRLQSGDPLTGKGQKRVRKILDGAGLLGAFLSVGDVGDTVGSFLLHIPSSFRKVTVDEALELDRARAAAIRDRSYMTRWTAGEDIGPADHAAFTDDSEAGARLVLLRPTRVELTDEIDLDEDGFGEYRLHLRTGEIIELRHQRRLPSRIWAVVRVFETPPERKKKKNKKNVEFQYSIVLAVPDDGALRVSDAASSISQALCLESLCKFFLSRVDLTDALDLDGESLPDPAAALDFLNTSHREGLPSGRVPERMFDEEAGVYLDKETFASRLLVAMYSSALAVAEPEAAPANRLIKTFADAESYAAEYMRFLGFADARTTPPGTDGGIDVVSGDAVAQVKMEGLPTGRPVIQALLGVASVEGKRALVFSLAGYTAQAREWADRARVACFEFAIDGSIEAANAAAENLLRGDR